MYVLGLGNKAWNSKFFEFLIENGYRSRRDLRAVIIFFYAYLKCIV